MWKIPFNLSVLLLLLLGCTPVERPNTSTSTEAPITSKDTASSIIAKAIEAHGGAIISQSKISFEFRGRQYIAARENGRFAYERIFQDSIDQHVRDVLTNNAFRRFVEGQEVVLDSTNSSNYANSVNSVIYFALLPYFLDDPAVQLEYLGSTAIMENAYEKVKVTFHQEGGGKDFQDEFLYWIDADKYTLDYLAYNYIVDGGGARFRKAYNIREVEGIRFADFVNYKPVSETMDIAIFDSLFLHDGLEELSRIELLDVEVIKDFNFDTE